MIIIRVSDLMNNYVASAAVNLIAEYIPADHVTQTPMHATMRGAISGV